MRGRAAIPAEGVVTEILEVGGVDTVVVVDESLSFPEFATKRECEAEWLEK